MDATFYPMETLKGWDEADREGLAFISELGHEVIPLSAEQKEAWTARVQPILAAYLERMREKGLPGEAFLTEIRAQLNQSSE